MSDEAGIRNKDWNPGKDWKEMRESADSALSTAEWMSHDIRGDALLRAIALTLLEIRDILKATEKK